MPKSEPLVSKLSSKEDPRATSLGEAPEKRLPTEGSSHFFPFPASPSPQDQESWGPEFDKASPYFITMAKPWVTWMQQMDQSSRRLTMKRKPETGSAASRSLPGKDLPEDLCLETPFIVCYKRCPGIMRWESISLTHP